ncbi:hypothetical protein CIB84_011996, partial [Bambusicola thoracicus]
TKTDCQHSQRAGKLPILPARLHDRGDIGIAAQLAIKATGVAGALGPSRCGVGCSTTFISPLIIAGICPVNRDSIDYILSKNGTGNAIIIVVGGAAESLNCTPGKNSVTLRNRKGFVKLALRHGADLVPVYSFGENEVYKQVIFEEGSWGRWVQKKFQKHIGFAPCIFHGRGLFSSNTWGLLPYSKPITTVVGEPITIPKIDNPSQKEVDFYHGVYVDSLIKLFDKYKGRFGLPETEVLEVN